MRILTRLDAVIGKYTWDLDISFWYLAPRGNDEPVIDLDKVELYAIITKDENEISVEWLKSHGYYETAMRYLTKQFRYFKPGCNLWYDLLEVV